MKIFYKTVFAFLMLVSIHSFVLAQCTSTISSFPYVEDFESNNGNWTTGGNASDWTWGTPQKQVIGNAASGNNCWIIGGLTNNSYSNGQSSFLKSPCFDFSSLLNPQIAFKIFWETEKKWDGTNLEYSVDGGNSWSVLGTINDNSNCTGENWFNNSAINNLGQGWSGNIQPSSGSCVGGSGSGAWLQAKHSLTNLAGKSSVVFRFNFVAGTACNNYDGFAIDAVVISETPPQTTDFTYACTSNNAVSFNNTSSICGTGFLWEFKDSANAITPFYTTNDENPSYTFPSPGKYYVQLTVTFPGNLLVTNGKNITIIQANALPTASILCNGDSSGKATVTVVPNGSYNYSWNSTPIQTTATAINLKANSYTVTIKGANVCTTNTTVTITQPNKITIAIDTVNEKCNNKKGSIVSTVNGGVLPYQYTWNNGASTSAINNLLAGNYSLQIKDRNNCVADTANIIIQNIQNNINVNLGNDTTICPGQKLILNAGTFAQYLWQNNSNNSTFNVVNTGRYFVKATDADGCFTSDTINVNVDCSDVYFPTAFTPNGDDKNKSFGAIGNVIAVKNYTLAVYGRWGELLFKTNNPYERWTAKKNGVDIPMGTYVWMATYTTAGLGLRSQKGTVTIIR